MQRNTRIEGLLVGAAVADAIGLPTEGMRPAKIERLGWGNSLEHRFFFRRGMWSDDTEHIIMMTQALLESGGDVKKFKRAFAWELRWWLLGAPAAVGLATAKAIGKLSLGFSADKSGVFSAGNGPVMRTAPIAAMFPHDAEARKKFVEAQTRITHSDPKAAISALAVTEVATLLLESEELPPLFPCLSAVSDDEEWQGLVRQLKTSINGGQTFSEFLVTINVQPEKGISGYVYQTVPAVLFLGIRNDWDFEKTITELVRAGGDTDTTAAIAGALCGAYGGVQSIPREWVEGVKDWPVGISQFSILAKALEKGTKSRVRPRWSPMLLMRNVIFLGVVILHGFARLLPLCFLKAKI